MKRDAASNSIYVFGLYMILVPGMGLIFIPEFILDFFRLSHGEELWLARMIGLLAFVIGAYYLQIVKYKIESLYNTSILLRFIASLFMICLWLINEVELMILLFASIDALGATWTYLSLKNTSDSK